MISVRRPVSIYLHVPFCGAKCTYCAFNTYIHLDSLIEPFVSAVIEEIRVVGESQPEQEIWTIYLGGGTPSLLTPEQVERILTTIHRYFHVRPDAEISSEANPADLNRPYLTALHGLGINRFSIGMQSANANELALFGRRHDNDAVVRAVSAARAAGIDNLNLDLIYGAPHQTLASWEASLRQALALQPEHLSLYALGLEDGTAMKAWVERGIVPTPDDDLSADMYELATDVLAGAGYAQYEISNWSKPGYESRHNLQYWRNWDYIGLGPGAHGYATGVRYWTILSPQKYIQVMQNVSQAYEYPRTPALHQATVVDWKNEVAETLIMGLRLTEEGISRPDFAQRFGIDLVELHRPILTRFAEHGLLRIETDKVRLTSEGRLLSNLIFRELV